MQLSVITKKKDIDAAQRQLRDRIREEAGPVRRRKLGFPSGEMEAKTCHVERLDLWHATSRLPNRWWNGFGFGDIEVPSLSIVAEVNPSFDGSRRSAGAFLQGADGKVWLAHSGRVGGGKKGVGRTAFLSVFSGSVEDVDGHDYVVIGRIDAKNFLDKLATFVRTVQSFKAGVDGQADDDDEGEEDEEEEVSGESDDFSEEPWGLAAVFPDADPATQRALMEWFAEALRHAHAQSASCWAVTRRDGPRLRLLVGKTVAFEIGLARVAVGLHLPSIVSSADATADAGVQDFLFKHIDGTLLRWFSIERFLARRDKLLTAAMRFIELAAAAYQNSPYAGHHAPELLAEFAELLGTPLPKPAHGGADIAPSYWKISPGARARLWPRCRDGGYIAIGWDELGDLNGLDRDGFDARLDEALVEFPTWKRGGLEQVWRFINIPPGAKIVANDGTRRVVGIGTVTGAYEYVVDGEKFAHRLPVRWDDVRERVVEQRGWVKTIIQLSPAVFAEVVNAPSPGEQVAEKLAPKAKPIEKLDFDGIMDRLNAAGLRFPEEIVASYLLALQAKRFVILSGISGTGKTQLALEVAKAFHTAGAVTELAPRPTTYRVVAVRPDWTDNRGLLGYYNPITCEYQTTPFLRLLLAAAEEEARAVQEGRPRLPFFAVLDEMNLARVEHYFSDFLSCLESGESLHLHNDSSVAEGRSESGEIVPMQISIPRNLFFTGTVNVDETTYMFSPKVLDRSFVLEFNDVDLATFGAPVDDDASDDASALRLKHFEGALDLPDTLNPYDYPHFREQVEGALHRALQSLHDRLQVDHRHFGYRVANEIARFVGLAGTQAGKHAEVLWDALDVAVLAKVLPKIHGTQQEVEEVLGRLLAFAVDVESPVAARDHGSHWEYASGRLNGRDDDGASKIPRLPRSAAKLWRMLRRVRQQGYVSFIE